MSQRLRVLSALADGTFHSGADLAARFGISRAAVWKHVQALRRYGVQPQSVRGRGYCLPLPIELLDDARLRAGLTPGARARLAALDVLWETDSTNQRLLEAAAHDPRSGRACLAEFQIAGRGRRGRAWEAPLGTGVCLSVAWRYARPAAELTPLGLAVGVACARAVESLGVAGTQLKWPNDVMVGGRKIAGILLEMSGEMAGPCTVVAGVGLNVRFPPALAGDFRQPWTDIATVTGGEPSRNDCAAALLGALLDALAAFEAHGFAAFAADWERYDCTRDRPVTVHLPQGPLAGIARGVEGDGALVVEIAGERRRFHAGEVSLGLPA